MRLGQRQAPSKPFSGVLDLLGASPEHALMFEDSTGVQTDIVIGMLVVTIVDES
jgi:beta-phosphoglucomutase-like phosphatase (HAD superfamily)